ncbi:MAG TPA: glucokinase [Burkholderiales bacterium]|nr:glucokinase [Burkholderiales bacterium]
MILAGDIGGTSTRLALFNVDGGRVAMVNRQTYPSADYDSLAAVVRRFSEEHGHDVDHAAFGVAGPVRDGQAKATNLPWLVDSTRLVDELGVKAVGLINDLEANAYGVAALDADDFTVLNAGEHDASGNAAIIAAGTGLGEAGLYWDGKRHHPFASEGGHADFAPRNELEIELLHYLLRRHDRVSYERVLSGPGLHAIYEFLRDSGQGTESQRIADAMREDDPAAVISNAALAGECRLCADALDMFVAFYGAAAGNLALKMMARGGMYLGGGIAPKIIEKLKQPVFMETFISKGRMEELLRDIPVHVIMNDQTALIGAARYAALRAGLLDG